MCFPGTWESFGVSTGTSSWAGQCQPQLMNKRNGVMGRDRYFSSLHSLLCRAQGLSSILNWGLSTCWIKHHKRRATCFFFPLQSLKRWAVTQTLSYNSRNQELFRLLDTLVHSVSHNFFLPSPCRVKRWKATKQILALSGRECTQKDFFYPYQ